SIRQDLEAGASLVIMETRESGKSGMCSPNGEVREEILQGIVRAGFALDHLLFEAPTKDLQVRFVKQFGADVNLGNIAPEAVIGLETLRLGLRSDTFGLR